MEKTKLFPLKGLRGKIFLLCVVLVITASLAFAIIGILQLRDVTRLAAETGNSQNTAVKQISHETLEQLTRESMLNAISLSAKNADGEFWTMQHDFSILAEQVRDVLEHPEHYKERELHVPDKANTGDYALQLIFADEKTAADGEVLERLGRLANLEPLMREIVRGNDDYTRDCYISLPEGATLAMDPFSDQKLDEDGNVRPYDPRVRPWYTAAVNKGDFCFTLAVHSFYLDLPEVEYGYPIYLDGKLAAVLQGSTRLDVIQEFVADVGIGDSGFSIMISDEGQLVYSPRKSGELRMVNDMSTDIRNTSNMSLLTLITEAQAWESGFGEAEIDGESYFAAYAGMPTAGWTQITFVPKAEMDRPTEELLAAMDEIGAEAEKTYSAVFRKSSRLMIGTVILLIANAFLTAVSFSGKILNPINIMTRKIKGLTGERFEFKVEDVYRTGDEIEVLAETFERLSEQMETYIQEILAMTAEKERVSTELAIAARIQTNMLPSVFPPYPERSEFELFASMSPAKEVGGDFYDFFLIDDDHLGIVIADVSDKGVPAALFMMSAKIILNYRAQLGGTPAEIFAAANNLLCQNNASMMFVTVWLGILEISTGRLTCSSAGHEYPFIRGRDGVFRAFTDEHGPVLGILEKAEYMDYEICLQADDAIFVYTDGVPEACTTNREFYGLDRLGNALNRFSDENPVILLKGVKADVDAFAEGAKQFDDMTMLCLRYRGTEEYKEENKDAEG